MLKWYETCISRKLLILMEYHMGTFLKLSNHISRTGQRIESKFSGNIVVDRVFLLLSWYWAWPSLAAITALSHRGMLRTRTCIFSGIIAPQAYNRVSRKPNHCGREVVHVSHKHWYPICSIWFRSGLHTGHCMISTSSPTIKKYLKNACISCIMGCGIVICMHKISLEICTSQGKEI